MVALGGASAFASLQPAPDRAMATTRAIGRTRANGTLDVDLPAPVRPTLALTECDQPEARLPIDGLLAKAGERDTPTWNVR